MIRLFRLNTFFDEVVSDDSAKAAADAEAAKKAADEAAKNKNRTYSEEEFQKAIKAERDRADENARKAIKELEDQKKLATTTAEQRVELQKKIDDLSQQFQTKEELNRTEKEKLKNTYEAKVKELEKDKETWQTRFMSSLMEREITDAAIAEKAHDPKIFVTMLRGNTEVVENVVEGVSKGFKTVIKLDSKDATGKQIELTLDPVQAIKHLKDKPEEFGYLFKGTSSPGLGGSGSKTLKQTDYAKLTPEEYRKHREQILKG